MSKEECEIIKSECPFLQKNSMLTCPNKKKQKCCEQYEGRKTISCKEQKSTFYLQTADGDIFYKVRLDGCVDNNQEIGERKCDFMIFDYARSKEIFIELKGNKILEAQKQIDRSIAKYSLLLSAYQGETSVCIVASSVPRAGGKSDAQIVKDFFAKKGIHCIIKAQELKCCYEDKELRVCQ